MPERPIPSSADVDRIAALADPVVRNHQITACYHALSTALTGTLGHVANWCTFATWASDQAGCTIRGEDLRQTLEQRLRGSAPLLDLAHERAPQVRQFIRDQAPLRRASAAVARGNLKVFAEIGREFARFLSLPPEALIASLRPGDPPDGQQLLREAFRAYAEAAGLDDPAERAQRILYANLLVGLHEQTRLQPEILEALDVARQDLQALRPHLLKLLLPSWWQRTRNLWSGLLGRTLPLDAALDRLIEDLCRETRELMTAELMTLRLPMGAIRLGRDLQADPPMTLTALTFPPLVALLERLDTRHAARAGRDRDWSDFDYRMGFIARLFRTHQERPELMQAPAA